MPLSQIARWIAVAALGAGPAPGYCMSLGPEARERLRDSLSRGLPRGLDGSIVFADDARPVA